MQNLNPAEFALGFAALGLIVIVAFALFIVRSGDFNGK
jgi:hypothetical protein